MDAGGPEIALIVAMADDGVMGRAGDLPWHLPADLRRFRQRTMGHAIVMGRKTYESLGRCLPGRRSIVISRRKAYNGVAASVADSWERALRLARGESRVFVIGGAEIYQLALPDVSRMFVTFVQGRFEGDTFFPPVAWDDWQVVEEARREADAKNRHAMRNVELVRRGCR